MLFCVCIECWGCPPQTRTQETFREKFLGTSKAFAKIKWCVRCESFCGFLRSFFKSSLKQGLERSSNILRKNKKRGVNRVFSCVLSVGAIRPKPGHKGLFEKSPLETQKLSTKQRDSSVRSSLAHLSPKERCVLLPTFLIRKVGGLPFLKER